MAEWDPVAAAAQKYKPIQSAVPGTTLGPIQINAFLSGGVCYFIGSFFTQELSLLFASLVFEHGTVLVISYVLGIIRLVNVYVEPILIQKLYDTPGVHLHHRQAAVVHSDDLPALAPRSRIRGQPFSVSLILPCWFLFLSSILLLVALALVCYFPEF